MNNELYHHGIKGQKWGIRRYRNKDGTLTPLGKKWAEREIQKFFKPNKLTLLLANRALKESAKLNGLKNVDDISLDKNMNLIVKNKDGSVSVGRYMSATPITNADAANAHLAAQSIEQHNDMARYAASISSASAMYAMDHAMAASNYALNASIVAAHHF